MWNMKEKVIPLRMGATGTISKSFRKYPSNKHTGKARNQGTLGIARIIR
jgi:hypothetical protein